MSWRYAALGLGLALLCTAGCGSKSEVKGTGSGAVTSPVPARPTFTLFALAELRGQIGPCGCTSDPLGDISRTAEVIDQARAAGPVLVVDAGSLLYSQSPVPAHLATQEELKANLIQAIYQKDLAVAAVGLGPADLAAGAAGVRFPRQSVNVSEKDVPTAPPQVLTVGTAKVGVFGVIARDTIPKLPIEDPVATGKQAVAKLRAAGAQVVVGLVQASSKRDAVALVRAIGGIDLAIAGLGQNAPEPDRVAIEADHVGDGWLVVPANRGQVVSRIEVTLRDKGGPLVDAIGPGAATARIEGIDRQIADLDAKLARFAADKDADPAFIASKKAEKAALTADAARLKQHPYAIPKTGSYFTLAQVRIAKTLACNVGVQDEIKAFNLAAGKANVAAAAKTPVPAPPKGQAHYVGMETCDDCHSEAVEFWQKTVHAQAWQTLVDRGQQFDYDCIGCHVTGFDKPGGSNLAHNDDLRNVQCEECHGPGSIHVAKGGEEKPLALLREPAKDFCATQCHTHEHSDTFQYEAYLRDILGPGHGEKERAKLGDGPTGHELRKAALDKAGRTLGAGCTK